MLRFVTSNRSKFLEIEAIGTRFGISMEMVSTDYPEMQSETLEEIALSSAKDIASDLGPGFFLEDSGLSVDTLGGFPGPYSSYVHRTIGNGGILSLLSGTRDRGASFVSVICHYNGEFQVHRGTVRGKIAETERGSSGFGFDPIFIPEGYSETFAEMGEGKNEISHRARASEIFFRSLGDASPEQVQ